MKITYWSDFACPYCYIGNTRLKKALNDLNINAKIKIKAFELDINAPIDVKTNTIERFSKKYMISLEDAKKQVNTISKLGQKEGLDFKYETTLYTNTSNAHQMMKLAEEKYPKILNKLSEKLFDTYFNKNLKLADKNTLIKIASEMGIKIKDMYDIFEHKKYLNKIRNDENEAQTLGIHAVPYYIINDTYIIPGAPSYNDFKQIFIKLKNDKIETNYCDKNCC